ncbi:MAG: hypothetical protein IJP52_05290 [Paludibacteraceae bacterium]|nr:hypothetical protein [Paludibacteraceae bacterium]
MKKIFISGALLMGSLVMLAGGTVTNTNMSAAYLRNPAREGAIDIDGIYYNPAGTAFLPNGIHASVGMQTAIQERNTKVTFEPFALNKDHIGNPTFKYKGKAFAPVIPFARLAYNWDRWNIQASFNVVGGGGKCKFQDGIGLLERVLAAKAYQLQAGTGQPVAYSLYSDIVGESYQFGVYVGTSYEIIKDHLAVSLGLQTVYATNSYEGGLSGMKMWMGNNYDVPAYNYLLGMAQQVPDPNTQAVLQATAESVKEIPDVLLDCTQKGFGATPVIGIDYRLNEKLNISARWQFQTYLKMKTKASNSPAAKQGEVAAQLKNAQDGESFRSDIPGYLMTGIQYAPIKPLRLAVSYRYFDEKHAERENISGLKNNKDNPGTHEVCFGLEWDIFKYLTFSCGYQGGIYQLRDKEMSDLDFQVNSNSILMGFRVNINEHWNLDLGYMHSFYDTRKVTTQVPITETASLPYLVDFSRKNDVVGIAVNMCY